MRKIICAFVFVCLAARAADHGPVFALATPTNPQGGWSADIAVNGRSGSGGIGAGLEGELSYGITPDLKVQVSGPLVIEPDPYTPSSVTLFTPMLGDFSALATWRFARKDLSGARIESAAIGGLLAPGPQAQAGLYRDMHSGPGFLAGGATGLASRSNYLWVGASFQRYAQSRGDRRPNLLTGSLAYAYRPQAWRTDYPRWDWRIFGEVTAEHAGPLQRSSLELPGTTGSDMFVGPSVLGVYRAIGIEGGLQFPVWRDTGRLYPRERMRFVVNLAYFF